MRFRSSGSRVIIPWCRGWLLRVDGVVAVPAGHEGLAPFLGHELSPRGLWLSRLGEIGERADVVHVHLGPLRAPFTSSRPEPVDQLFAFAAGGGGGLLAGVLDAPFLPGVGVVSHTR